MVKFIQTSDWQIGMKGSGLGDAGPLVRETRVESIHNVLKSAEEENADFVLMCGDIFEHNMITQEEVKRVIKILNGYPEIPLYLLPGNHDIIGPDCIYGRPIFQKVENLTIMTENNLIEVKEVILHPCPITSKFTTEDVTKVINDVNKTDRIQIGVAHGSLIGKFPTYDWENINLPIDPHCVDRTGLDYLALGHWHSHREYEDNNGITRIAYSGTHEQTNYNEDNAGQCLLVQIDHKGATPIIKPIKTGQLSWISDEFEIKDDSSISELEEYLESIKDFDMVKLVIYGNLPLDSKERLDDLLEFQTTLHENFRVKLDALNILTTLDLEEEYDYGDPTLNQTEEELKRMLVDETDSQKKMVIAEAITNLRRLGREV